MRLVRILRSRYKHYIENSIQYSLPDILQCLYRQVYNSNSLMDRLLILQQRIKHRIEQAKKQIHPTHNRAFIDSVLIEIDTLDHDLAQHGKRNC